MKAPRIGGQLPRSVKFVYRSPLLGAILLLEPYVKLLEQPLAIPGSTEVSLGSVFPHFSKLRWSMSLFAVHILALGTLVDPRDLIGPFLLPAPL